MHKYVDVGVLKGKVLTAITKSAEEHPDTLRFHTDDGEVYKMYHIQDCCESVYLEDINGDLVDLLNSPLLVAEVVSNVPEMYPLNEYDNSYTWTFYKFATIRGSVTLRWYGTSNGYYSESVYFMRES